MALVIRNFGYLNSSSACKGHMICTFRSSKCSQSLRGTPRGARIAALPDGSVGSISGSGIDIKQLSDVITAQTLDSSEQHHALSSLAAALGEPLAVVRNMAFRQRTLLELQPGEVRAKVEEVARVVEVPYEQARRMAVIQPALLTDTARQAEALAAGLRLLCHSLRAERGEMVELLLSHPSLLHGRSMRLSVADIANLALLREPRGRIVD